YFMAKEKAQLTADMDVDALLKKVALTHAGETMSTVDGLKIDFDEAWVHMRKSNTEPIVRIYTEAGSQAEADALAAQFVKQLEASSLSDSTLTP
ncbi:phosphoglucosamine mutase, partial [Schleiferiaceae bacterium]|nr:phosphoglucosamine mutase [Schleiferiaceae bacterium]